MRSPTFFPSSYVLFPQREVVAICLFAEDKKGICSKLYIFGSTCRLRGLLALRRLRQHLLPHARVSLRGSPCGQQARSERVAAC